MKEIKKDKTTVFIGLLFVQLIILVFVCLFALLNEIRNKEFYTERPQNTFSIPLSEQEGSLVSVYGPYESYDGEEGPSRDVIGGYSIDCRDNTLYFRPIDED